MIIVPSSGQNLDWWPRIAIGDVVDLQKGLATSLEPGAIAAYHQGIEIGYLAGEALAGASALASKDELRAKVVGQILSEEGALVGLDVQLLSTREGDIERQEKAPRNSASLLGRRAAKVVTALIGFYIALAIMEASSTGPVQSVQSQSWSDGRSGPVVVGQPRSGLKSTARPEESGGEAGDTIAAEQRYELWRRSQEIAARREWRARRRLLDLAAAQEALAEREQKIRAELARMQAENHALEARIAEMTHELDAIAAQPLQNEKAAELEALNKRELLQHQLRVAAWKLSRPAAGRTGSEATAEAKSEKAKAIPPPNTAKQDALESEACPVRKKANFSRYAVENQKLRIQAR